MKRFKRVLYTRGLETVPAYILFKRDGYALLYVPVSESDRRDGHCAWIGVGVKKGTRYVSVPRDFLNLKNKDRLFIENLLDEYGRK